MAVRAESLYGRFSIVPRADGGTLVEWDVPLVE
jgi:signal transduction histidine kinase